MADDSADIPRISLKLSDSSSTDNTKIPLTMTKHKIGPSDGICWKCKHAIFKTHFCKVYSKKNPHYSLHYLTECNQYRKRRIWFKWLKILLLKLVYWKRFIPDNEYFDLMNHVLPEDDEDE